MSNLFHTTVGLWLTFLISHLFGIKPEWQHFALGALFANLPDSDGLIEFVRNGIVAAHKDNPRDHREGLHYPLAVIVIGLLVALPFGTYWSLMLGLNLLFHFVVDSYGLGWGIKWLHPFSKKNFKILQDGKLIVSWSPQELKESIVESGDKDWLKKYLTSPLFYAECVLFSITIVWVGIAL